MKEAECKQNGKARLRLNVGCVCVPAHVHICFMMILLTALLASLVCISHVTIANIYSAYNMPGIIPNALHVLTHSAQCTEGYCYHFHLQTGVLRDNYGEVTHSQHSWGHPVGKWQTLCAPKHFTTMPPPWNCFQTPVPAKAIFPEKLVISLFLHNTCQMTAPTFCSAAMKRKIRAKFVVQM